MKNLKTEFLAKTPHQKWITVRQFNMFLLKLTGTHIMLPDWEKSMRLLIPAWLETNMSMLMIYTMFYYRHDFIQALSATVVIALMVPVSVSFNLQFYPILFKFLQISGFNFLHFGCSTIDS